ncbi:N-terminal EF-hand calcium-binding protein 1-like [Ptychodera flava]|uniref:N-terminal EF-hand calcium-binding protein 1-like n=1 Tax=Ptychodera flava TaxID=63121 RepID=UPI00396A27EE
MRIVTTYLKTDKMADNQEKGMSIFLDVFRRADKNDDNALSLEEFKSFFADGVVDSEELEKLFHEIDTHNTNNIDTGELCAYFSQHLGPFREIFAALEDVSGSVTKALQSTAKSYPEASFNEQFSTRFLLKEVVNQLSALQYPIDAASDHMEEEAIKDRPTKSQAENVEAIVPSKAGWIKRRERQQALATQTSVPYESLVGLSGQVERLQSLVDKLEHKVTFDPIDEEVVAEDDDENTVVLVCRNLYVDEEKYKEFKSSLTTYIEALAKEDGCLNISVRKYSDTNHFVLYQIFDSIDSWKSHFSGKISKTFQHNNVDYLEKPEALNTMDIPAKWLEEKREAQQ